MLSPEDVDLYEQYFTFAVLLMEEMLAAPKDEWTYEKFRAALRPPDLIELGTIALVRLALASRIEVQTNREHSKDSLAAHLEISVLPSWPSFAKSFVRWKVLQDEVDSA